MNSLQPGGGWTQRALSALVLLLALSYGAHLIYDWTKPLVPTAWVLLVLAVLGRLVLNRRR